MLTPVLFAAAMLFQTQAELAAPAGSPAFSNIVPDCAALTVLPEPTGPNQVGRTNLFFVDEAREEIATPEPVDLRQVPVTLWYPGLRDRDVAPAPYMAQLDMFLGGFAADSRPFLREIGAGFSPLACVLGHSFEDIAASDLAPDFPVIVFSPGGTMSRFWYSALAQELATHGYVVAMTGHAHSGTDVNPSGGLHFDPVRWRAPEDASEQEARAIEDRLADLLAGDVRFVLDRLEDIAAGRIAHPLNGRLDLSAPALGGHSRGGDAVARGCAQDRRFASCITLDNIGPDRETGQGLDQPQLVIRAPWPQSRAGRLAGYLSLNRSVAIDAVLPGAGHFDFSDMPLVLSERYDTEIGAGPATIAASRLIRAFLDGLETDPAALAASLHAIEPFEITVHADD